MPRLTALLVVLTVVAAGCGTGSGDTLTVYSGRSEDLVGPLIARFEAEGIDVEVRYGDSQELAATILQEGENSPADVFFSQDPASLGVVANAGLLSRLDTDVTDVVPAAFRDPDGEWVGVSGRVRVVVYDTTKIDAADLPATEDGFTDPSWAGRVAIAPTNGSFLAFVAAKILIDGEDATLDWLRAMAGNGAPTYPRNSVIVAAVDDGEVDAGLVNHYYLFRRRDEVGDVVAANHFLAGGGAGSLVIPAGVGVLRTSDNPNEAAIFARFLLSAEAQAYFAEETYEYPLAGNADTDPALPPLGSLRTPDIDLSSLATVLDRATDLVAEAGLL